MYYLPFVSFFYVHPFLCQNIFCFVLIASQAKAHTHTQILHNIFCLRLYMFLFCFIVCFVDRASIYTKLITYFFFAYYFNFNRFVPFRTNLLSNGLRRGKNVPVFVNLSRYRAILLRNFDMLIYQLSIDWMSNFVCCCDHIQNAPVNRNLFTTLYITHQFK